VAVTAALLEPHVAYVIMSDCCTGTGICMRTQLGMCGFIQ